MALIPCLDYEVRPRGLHGHLGLDLMSAAEDYLTDMFDRPLARIERYIRPWRNLTTAARDIGSTIKINKDQFQINLNVQHFIPEEISVKTADGFVVIECKRQEKGDESSLVSTSREFRRCYALPEGCDPETLETRLSNDGVLTIAAHKMPKANEERLIPIIYTGPVRRKRLEDQEINRGPEEGTKSPDKKRKC